MNLRQISKLHKGTKGFTLIELMIVVAIIGILAAIAIPQFAAYRVRGFNASALSDLRSMSTSQAAFFADFQGNGVTASAAPGNAIVTAGTRLTGPIAPATPPVQGLHQFLRGAAQFLEISLGNGNSIISHVDNSAQSFTAATKHVSGNTWYAVDSDVSSIFAAVGQGADAGVVLVAADCPDSTPGADDVATIAVTTGTTPAYRQM